MEKPIDYKPRRRQTETLLFYLIFIFFSKTCFFGPAGAFLKLHGSYLPTTAEGFERRDFHTHESKGIHCGYDSDV